MSVISGSDVKRLIIACEAGMGSSVMVANMIAKQLKGIDIQVTHSPVNGLASADPSVVVCHRGLAARAKQAVPNVPVIAFDMFLGDPRISAVIAAIKDGTVLSDE
ncbi:MAG: PTS lactose transporter subunit IIB [Actinomycetes bacterium]